MGATPITAYVIHYHRRVAVIYQPKSSPKNLHTGYHTKLRCYCVVELKATEFKPEYVGMMSFYLSAVDDLVRSPQDAPTIGIILCRSKKGVTVEYALRNLTRPVGVADYEVTLLESLLEELKDSLPTTEEIEHRLELGLSTKCP